MEVPVHDGEHSTLEASVSECMHAPRRMLILETKVSLGIVRSARDLPDFPGLAAVVPWPLVCWVAGDGSLFVWGYAIWSGL